MICAATLPLKLLVPTGYMIDSDHGGIAITMCSGTDPVTAMMDVPGMHGDASDYGEFQRPRQADVNYHHQPDYLE